MISDNLERNQSIKPNSKEMTKLKNNFPQYFDKDGQFLIDRFNRMLEQEEVDIQGEGYELNFLGKNYAKYLSSTETETVLTPDIKHNNKDKNKESENLYLVGDNLDSIKHLLNSYSETIKCIYIDPPYNTGSDGFVYPDKFNFNKESLAETIGITESEAERILNLTGKSTHSAWLTFLYPRMLLARDFLTDDGVIFISIDENEMANLQLLCDEVFGEENRIGEIVRNTNSSKNQSLFLSTSHDYCLVYSKNISVLTEKHSDNKWSVPKNNVKAYLKKVEYLQEQGLSNEEITKELKQLTKYPRFIDFENYWYLDNHDLYRKGDLGGVKNGNMTPIVNPLTGEEDRVPPGGYRHDPYKMKELIKNKKIHFHTDGSLPTIKRYLSENLNQRPKAIMSDDQRPDDKLMKEFGTPFSNPKQLAFMKRILSIVDSDSIIMDFFSGSATTAHATMALNAEDGGNRKFIMVQLPEVIDSTDPAYKKGYRTIDEIGRTRIEKSGEKVKEETGVDIDGGYKLFYVNQLPMKTVDKMLSFDPQQTFAVDDPTSIFSFNGTPGDKTMLATWLNKDGYGLSAIPDYITLDTYSAPYLYGSLYIIKEDIYSEDVIKLIKLIEENKLNIKRVVIYPYSVRFNIIHELKKNLKNLRNGKKVTVIERY
ncbi:adenine-specific DNA-methyltransferase [Lentibacillus persicus]|uniref:Adenine-specific DNA-methyltransferase n=1 Tax=Lentibacillus persicus TaxID=640948 RepID=A0A1I1ZRB7_9BACI|nr:site-specific DNA-methyltransferase [Lentibacillus persicus]SFE33958.1 adenine-specific DNA-methyltransferase [Lentibacillus persicus]